MILVVRLLSRKDDLFTILYHRLFSLIIIFLSSLVRFFEGNQFITDSLMITRKLYDILFNSNDRVNIASNIHLPLGVFLRFPYLIEQAVHICLCSLFVVLGSL